MRFETGLALFLGPIVLALSAKYAAWWDKKNGYGATYRRVSDPEKQEPQQPQAIRHSEQEPPQ